MPVTFTYGLVSPPLPPTPPNPPASGLPPDKPLPFQPYSHAANRTMWMSLIRPIRDADMDQGRLLLQRFLARQEVNADATAGRITSLKNLDNFSKIPDKFVAYLAWNVGITSDLAKLTAKLSPQTLRKFAAGAIGLWKRRGTPQSTTDLIRFLTGRSVTYRDWFFYRTIIGEATVSDEQLGSDLYVNGGQVTTQGEYFSNLRMMDPGAVGLPTHADPNVSQLILDIINLTRPISERVEVLLLDFFDTFDDGSRANWTNVTPGTEGVAAVSGQSLVFSPGCEEEPRVTIVSPVTLFNYLASHKFTLNTDGNTHRVKVYVGADTAHYRIDVTAGQVVLSKVMSGGVATAITTYTFATPMSPLVTGVAYGFRVQLNNNDDGSVTLRVYIDGSLVIDTTDATPVSWAGAYRIVNPATSPGTNTVDNTELTRLPARTAMVGPSGYEYSSTFLNG